MGIRIHEISRKGTLKPCNVRGFHEACAAYRLNGSESHYPGLQQHRVGKGCRNPFESIYSNSPLSSSYGEPVESLQLSSFRVFLVAARNYILQLLPLKSYYGNRNAPCIIMHPRFCIASAFAKTDVGKENRGTHAYNVSCCSIDHMSCSLCNTMVMHDCIF